MTPAGFCFCLLALVLCLVSATLRIEPKTSGGFLLSNGSASARKELFLRPGESLTLTCTSDWPGRPLNWTRVLQRDQDPSVVVRGISGTSVTLNSIRGSDGGDYVCSDGTSKVSYFVNVWDNQSLVPQNVLTNGTYVHVYLKCHQRFAFNFPLTWTRKVGDTTYILNDHPADDKNYTIGGDEDGYHLSIFNHEYRRYPLKTGQYQCQLNTSRHSIPAGLQPLQQTVTYEATPDVRIDGERSATTASPFTATCIYSGAANDRVRWIFTNDSGEHETARKIVLVDYDDVLIPCPNAAGTEDPDRKCLAENPRVSLTRDRSLENSSTVHEHTSVLYISNTTLEDRGTYECFVRSDHGENTAATFLRIKDKYAALWPAIGVLAEIVLLLLIIFLCERRRSRVEEEEEARQPLNANAQNNNASAEPAVAIRNRK
ncbi:hypothetical protein RvY_13926 [Ramazzottius varieornatus]|uniref:Ig-like domain-containing protein n=1 Tax=Ramazzottius varieornatus TaxID=947166 RepID=A0A1D1VPL4_RAMVA|nr:hypothetical protein RvY_13926 [Ramazzottius varieornatus]